MCAIAILVATDAAVPTSPQVYEYCLKWGLSVKPENKTLACVRTSCYPGGETDYLTARLRLVVPTRPGVCLNTPHATVEVVVVLFFLP